MDLFLKRGPYDLTWQEYFRPSFGDPVGPNNRLLLEEDGARALRGLRLRLPNPLIQE